MLKRVMLGAVLIAAVATAATAAEGPAVVRKVLNQQDMPNNQTMVELLVEIPAGGREGRHSHPGGLMVYVTDGVISLDYEGKPTVDYKAGDVFYVEPDKIHEGINKGTVTARAIATYAGPKGQLTKQAQ
jgi:quercetin dioxygenase-like cupin family protein